MTGPVLKPSEEDSVEFGLESAGIETFLGLKEDLPRSVRPVCRDLPQSA